MPQPSSGPRPFQSYLVEWMQNELLRREAEYLDDRQRAHERFARVVDKMQEELFHYRTTNAANHLLIKVDEMVNRLKSEQAELKALGQRWK